MQTQKEKIVDLVNFCLESFFSGAVNLAEGLPPGFSSSDIESPEEYINQTPLDETDEAEPLLGKDDTGVSSPDMDTMLKKKSEFGGKADHETPYVHRSAFTVIGDDNKEIDLDKLKSIITKRPNHILKQNAKIQHSGGKDFIFFNLTLPAYKGLWYDERANEFKMVTTCPSADTCKQICYARKGGYVLFPASFAFSASILNFLLNDWQGFKNQLTNEIKSVYKKYTKKNTTVVIRWHDSGDFFNEKYLKIALDIAKETPEVIHYAYTKSVGMVSAAEKPKNFVFNFSMGGTQDASIKPEDKKSIVVPRSIFGDMFPNSKSAAHLDFSGDIPLDKLETIKYRLSQTYSIPKESIITYKQLLDIPYNQNDPAITPKYNVIVKPGDGDDAAMRKDVLHTLLFIH
jgi:hypothetical protein